MRLMIKLGQSDTEADIVVSDTVDRYDLREYTTVFARFLLAAGMSREGIAITLRHQADALDGGTKKLLFSPGAIVSDSNKPGITGKVIFINADKITPVFVEFSDGDIVSYTEEGKRWLNDAEPSLSLVVMEE